MKLIDKEEGCYFEDKINIELSPFQVVKLISEAESRALETNSYESQGVWREIKDCLQGRHDLWNELRKKAGDDHETER